MPIQSFKAHIADAEIADLNRRLDDVRLPDQISGSGWKYGTPRDVLEEWIAYWRNEFDWRAVEAQFNAYEQGIAVADAPKAERVHFIHACSPEAEATPLVIIHGWPGSVVEFLEMIEPLRDPAAHGGDPSDAFHVVCPHIPGYGFSGPTMHEGFHADLAAVAIDDMMVQLGYPQYIAQGGDWGGVITRRLAEAHSEHVLGAHFNFLLAFPEDMAAPEAWEGVTPEELKAFQEASAHILDGTAYSAIQSTRPQTLAYGMHDSPAALLAWQLEKFQAWSHSPLAEAYTKDTVLANVALYWYTHTANSASRLYYESTQAGNYASDPWSGTVEVPIGYCRFPRELTNMPRAWAEKRYKKIVHWTQAERGGHFAAMENPTFMVEDLRAFRRCL